MVELHDSQFASAAAVHYSPRDTPASQNSASDEMNGGEVVSEIKIRTLAPAPPTIRPSSFAGHSDASSEYTQVFQKYSTQQPLPSGCAGDLRQSSKLEEKGKRCVNAGSMATWESDNALIESRIGGMDVFVWMQDFRRQAQFPLRNAASVE
ncbi:unnamed protein product [Clonostachys rhizophaga]|uniref:Uncharacterized protein n=1 Tax=Clonostachys rhizophaga TaxID=160324 RepID=A0A9N9V681_9HYPO|nr:unnamed protein product [Clonostachys rhizophaga]